jgi:hypothetical protein
MAADTGPGAPISCRVSLLHGNGGDQVASTSRGRAVKIFVAAAALAVAMSGGSWVAPEAAHAAFKTFGPGVHRVGTGISPGTYRTRSSVTNCYWARLSGFSGQLKHIIANDFSTGFQVVTIKATDKGFDSSRCGRWTSDLSRVTASMTQFGQGTFIVGTDMKPGTYRSSKGDGCYWARLRNFTGQLGGIIANDFRLSGRATVTIRGTDKGFTSSRCGTWSKV